ncbi:Ankyrin repeats (3 copies)/Ankyrin repeat [Novymonas esmeraldas]|uniref:Ankyrin repeats (3 copies)/Ankyrin repeat n=1 Tax=Novymonas esmeraldas TaxID=1808958 RepID=A0AAW0EQF5_9TRYP
MARKGKGQQAQQQQQQQQGPANSSGGGGKTKQEDSPLWTALKHGDEEAVQRLLFDEVDDAESGEVRLTLKPTAKKLANQASSKRVYPLSYAVSEGLGNNTVMLLLRAGAAVNKTDETAKQSTALHAACWNEDEAAAATLLRAGADPRVVDADGRTPLHILATSNAVSLVLLLLGNATEAESSGAVGATATAAAAEGEGEEGRSGGAGDVRVNVSSSAVRLDPVDLLGVVDRLDGATALHLALAEPAFGYGVAQALLSYLEKLRDASDAGRAAVAKLVSATAAVTGDTPLHALVGAPNTEDAIVEALTRRLLGLGADPSSRNQRGQPPVEVAIECRSSTSARAAAQIVDTLVTAMCADNVASIATVNENGLALIHVAVMAKSTAAVKTLCSAVAGPAQAQELLGRPATAAGGAVSLAELLVRSDAAAEMVNALVAAGAVLHDEYATLQRERAAPATVDAVGKGEDEEVEEQDGDDAQEEEGDREASGAVSAGLTRRLGGASGSAGGLSRVQQARKARAMTAANRKLHGGPRHAQRDGASGGGGGLFDGGLSKPVMVVGVLLLLSVLVSGYTMLADPSGTPPR